MQEQTRTVTPYWRRTKQLTTVLLLAWFVITFCVLFFARELSSLHFFGWPFSFYMAAQGLTLIYVLLLGIFSVCSHRIEQFSRTDVEDIS